MKQGQTLTARRAFAFKAKGAKGRAVTVQQGARFWITNSALDQSASGIVMIDREGRGTISHGYAFTIEQIGELFAMP
jgi:hypothetical protein